MMGCPYSTKFIIFKPKNEHLTTKIYWAIKNEVQNSDFVTEKAENVFILTLSVKTM